MNQNHWRIGTTKRELLKFYKSAMKDLELPGSGLCFNFGFSTDAHFLLTLFAPTPENRKKYDKELNRGWWLSGEFDARRYEFTVMRQTVVCFIMALSVSEKRKFIEWLRKKENWL